MPISPLIALDRERCILCYRCTRFSADVAQDELLIPRERGSRSIIATFEERPYASPFSGNVTELCPVGALTTTGYRFKARPWEIDNVPTVCGLCPTGCNTWATVREDEVRRVLSRDRSDLDEGWLCDKGRFAFEHVRADDRYVTALVRGDRGLDEASWEDAAETVARRLRHFANLYGPEAIAIVASGEQSNEEAFAWREIAEAAGGATLVGSGRPWELLDPYRATIADLDAADVIVVAGDREPRDLAGVIELRIRKAVRRGATLILAGAGGTQLDLLAAERIATAPGQVADSADSLVERLSAAEHPVLLVTDPVPLELVASIASRGGLAIEGRRRAAAARGAERARRPCRRLPRRSRERARTGRARRAAHAGHARRRRSRLARPAREPLARCAAARGVGRRVVALPERGHALGARDPARDRDAREGGHDDEPRGSRPAPPPDAAAARRRHPRAHVPRRARPPARHAAARPRGRDPSPPRRRRAPELPGLGAHRRPGSARPTREGDGRQGAAPREAEGSRRRRAAGRRRIARSSPARRSSAPSACASSAPAEIVLAIADAERLGLSEGQQVVAVHAGGRTSGPLHISRTQQTGAVRIPWAGARRHRRRDRRGGGLVPDGFIVSAIKAFALVNLLMGFFAIMTVTERKVIGRLQERYGPNRVGPVGLPAADRRPRQAGPEAARDPLGCARQAVPRRAVRLAVRRHLGVRRDPVRRARPRSRAPTGRCSCSSATRTSASCTSPRSARWGSTAC